MKTLIFSQVQGSNPTLLNYVAEYIKARLSLYKFSVFLLHKIIHLLLLYVSFKMSTSSVSLKMP